MTCNRCGSEATYKSGHVKGEQRYRCKACGRQFVPTRHRGRSENEKLLALLLYVNGLSLRNIGRLLNVTAPAVLKWIRRYPVEYSGKSKPDGSAVIVGVDEVQGYINNRKTDQGLLVIALPVGLSRVDAGVIIAPQRGDEINHGKDIGAYPKDLHTGS